MPSRTTRKSTRGHEPQIDPWLTRTTAGLAQFQRLIGVVATNKDAAAEMEQFARTQGQRGKTAQPSISHSGQGLEGKKSSSLPVEGGIFYLTFPFIDQAIALTIRESLSSGPMRGGSILPSVYTTPTNYRWGSGARKKCTSRRTQGES